MSVKVSRIPPFVVTVIALSVLYGLSEVLVSTSRDAGGHQAGVKCKLDGEGTWAIGTFYGPSPFELVPLEQRSPRVDTTCAWPPANPVITCATLTNDTPLSPSGVQSLFHASHTATGTFAADPFLLQQDKELYIFYEIKTAATMQGDIAAAISTDGGASFTAVGIVLDEPWHLSYPFVLRHKGQVYMLPEGSASGQLWLYRAVAFPHRWERHHVLVDRPLIDASLAQWGGRWWMFASDRGRRSEKGCRELEIWHSDDLLGPWELLGGRPVQEGVVGSRNAGRPFTFKGQLYRLGQDCQATYGHRLRAFRVTSLNTTTPYQEEEVPLPFLQHMTAKGPRHWSGVRHHHMDTLQLPDGSWMAAIDGDRHVSNYRMMAMWAGLGRTAVVMAAVLLMTVTGRWCFQRRVWLWTACQRWGPLGDLTRRWRGGHNLKSNGSAHPSSLHEDDDSDHGGGAGVAHAGQQQQQQPCLKRPNLSRQQRWGLIAVVALASLMAAAWLFVTLCRWPFLLSVIWYTNTFSGPPEPVAVAGQFSQFTLLVTGQTGHTLELRAYLKHYSRCPSVSDIVVVWDDAAPQPDAAAFKSAVPIRIRREANSSLNHRFRPDPLITNRAVLLLDVHLYLPCSDLEHAFAAWRVHPHRLIGFHTVPLGGQGGSLPCEPNCGDHAAHVGRHSIIASGSVFVDHRPVFKAYWADSNAAGRLLVDESGRCDDVLLDHVVAHQLAGQQQHTQIVRPSMCFDVRSVTGQGAHPRGRGKELDCQRRVYSLFKQHLHTASHP